MVEGEARVIGARIVGVDMTFLKSKAGLVIPILLLL